MSENESVTPFYYDRGDPDAQRTWDRLLNVEDAINSFPDFSDEDWDEALDEHDALRETIDKWGNALSLLGKRELAILSLFRIAKLACSHLEKAKREHRSAVEKIVKGEQYWPMLIGYFKGWNRSYMPEEVKDVVYNLGLKECPRWILKGENDRLGCWVKASFLLFLDFKCHPPDFAPFWLLEDWRISVMKTLPEIDVKKPGSLKAWATAIFDNIAWEASSDITSDEELRGTAYSYFFSWSGYDPSLFDAGSVNYRLMIVDLGELDSLSPSSSTLFRDNPSAYAILSPLGMATFASYKEDLVHKEKAKRDAFIEECKTQLRERHESFWGKGEFVDQFKVSTEAEIKAISENCDNRLAEIDAIEIDDDMIRKEAVKAIVNRLKTILS